MPIDRATHRKRHSFSGFTLLEVVVVLALISIFTVLAIAQYTASDASLTAQAQVLASHLRYAQMRSMGTESNWGILYKQSGGYYQLFKDSNTNIAQLPGENGDRVGLSAMGITLSSARDANLSNQDFEISFDSWGSPRSKIAGSDTSDTVFLSMTKPGNATQNLVVTRNTGFIP